MDGPVLMHDRAGGRCLSIMFSRGSIWSLLCSAVLWVHCVTRRGCVGVGHLLSVVLVFLILVHRGSGCLNGLAAAVRRVTVSWKNQVEECGCFSCWFKWCMQASLTTIFEFRRSYFYGCGRLLFGLLLLLFLSNEMLCMNKVEVIQKKCNVISA